MNTKTIHHTIATWAEQTDPRIQVKSTRVGINSDLVDITEASLQIQCEITRDKPFLGILIPHGRRTPMYYYGNNANDIKVDECFPMFEDENELRNALTTVYRRFMTDHGMMRFDDSEESLSPYFRPNLVECVTRWLEQKEGPQYTLKEIPPTGEISWKPGILVSPKGKNPSGAVILIHHDRSLPQKPISSTTGGMFSFSLPAFYTESELLYILQNNSSRIDSANKSIRKKSTK